MGILKLSIHKWKIYTGVGMLEGQKIKHSEIAKTCLATQCCIYNIILIFARASPVPQMVKNLPPIWDSQVQSLGQEDPLEKKMATCSHSLAWKTSSTDESAVHGAAISQTQRSTFRTHTAFDGVILKHISQW